MSRSLSNAGTADGSKSEAEQRFKTRLEREKALPQGDRDTIELRADELRRLSELDPDDSDRDTVEVPLSYSEALLGEIRRSLPDINSADRAGELAEEDRETLEQIVISGERGMSGESSTSGERSISGQANALLGRSDDEKGSDGKAALDREALHTIPAPPPFDEKSR